MAIKQIIQILITLLGDGASSVFTYAVEQMYLNQVGSATAFGPYGVPPNSAVVNNPPVPVTSVTVDANGNLTITLTSPLGNGVTATFEIDLQYNSGSATSSSPTQAQTVSVFGTPAIVGTLTHNAAIPAATNIGVLPAVASAAAPTYNASDQVLLSTDLSGNLRVVGSFSSGALPDLVGTTAALNALNAAATINAFGYTSIGGQLAAGTLIGTLVAECSLDGGTTWTSTYFDIGNKVTSIVFSSANTATAFSLVGSAGASNYRVRVSTFTSGTANCTLRANEVDDPIVTYTGVVAANVQPPAVSQQGGWVTTAVPVYATGTINTLSLTTAGGLRTDMSSVAGTTTVTAAAGVQKVGIVGNTGASVDSTVGSGAAPTNAIAVSGIYNVTEPAPTNTQATALQQDQAANLLTFPGLQFKVGAAWTSATTINTLQYQTGTTTQGALTGAAAIRVQLDQTTTLTGGAVTFQGTFDNINWVTIPVTQVLNPNTFASLTNPYTFVASTNQAFLINLNGYVSVRANLTTVITGTGSVTPYWATTAAPLIQPISVSSNSGTLTVAIVPTSNTFFRFGNVTTSSTNAAKVEATTYTEQSTGAQRSMSSSSALDTSAGTGARTVAIVWYDSSGNGPNTETVTLNGTTAVATVSTTMCFIESMKVVTVGSTGSNQGTITLFVNAAGGGGTIGTIGTGTIGGANTTIVGTNQTYWAHHYVPNGKTFHLTGQNIGSTSTTVGGGGFFTLYAQPVPVANQPVEQVADNLVLYGQSSTATRNYNSPVNVVGPSRITLWVSPNTSSNQTYFGSFDYFEQ